MFRRRVRERWDIVSWWTTSIIQSYQMDEITSNHLKCVFLNKHVCVLLQRHGYCTLGEAFNRLDFSSAIQDVRRFNYVVKVRCSVFFCTIPVIPETLVPIHLWLIFPYTLSLYCLFSCRSSCSWSPSPSWRLWAELHRRTILTSWRRLWGKVREGWIIIIIIAYNLSVLD